MKTLVGAWLGNDLEKNEIEIEALISLANEGCVTIAAVGNEVMYRNDLTEDQLSCERSSSKHPGWLCRCLLRVFTSSENYRSL